MSEAIMYDSQSSSMEEDEVSWIAWYCGKEVNRYLCEVDEVFIRDNFSMYGIRQMFPNQFNRGMELILGQEEDQDYFSRMKNGDRLVSMAMDIYAIIHARFILTPVGMNMMREKYVNGDFGMCPRTLCRKPAHLIPIGISDELGVDEVNRFCIQCEEIYTSEVACDQLDGAHFGTTFPHLFFMTFPDLATKSRNPAKYMEKNDDTGLEYPLVYTPRCFGFPVVQNDTQTVRISRRHYGELCKSVSKSQLKVLQRKESDMDNCHRISQAKRQADEGKEDSF